METPVRGGTFFRLRVEVLLLALAIGGNMLIQYRHVAHVIAENGAGAKHENIGDAEDYLIRAELLHASDFVTAFSDAYRMPGYPAFLALAMSLSDSPIALVLLLQVLFASATIPICYLVLRRQNVTSVHASLACAAIACWLPLYYYSQRIAPEAVCMPFLALFVLCLISVQFRPVFGIVSASLTLVLLTYLRPNYSLLLLALIATIVVSVKGRVGRIVRLSMLAVGLCVACLGPWAVFASRATGSVVGLTTASGVNLYLGTGQGLPSLNTSKTAVSVRLARRLQLDQTLPRDRVDSVASLTSVEQDRFYSRLAKEAWASNPLKLSLHACAKVIHAVGGSLRGPADLAQLLLTVLAGFAVVVYLKGEQFRTWRAVYFCFLLPTVVQTAAFLPNQRFRVALLDIPSLLTIAIAIDCLIRRSRALGETPLCGSQQSAE